MTVFGSAWLRGASGTRVWLAVAVAALCGVTGYLAPVPIGTSSVSRVAEASATFVHPGAVLAEAARRMHPPTEAGTAEMAGLDGDIDRSVDVTPPAPRPDIAEVFRRELSAVVTEDSGQPAVVLATEGGFKRIAVGGVYREGWRVQEIAPDAVKLVRRREVRRVAVMGDYPAVASGESSLVFAQAPRRRVLSRADARGELR